jgi:hypothetical protein
VEASHPFIYTVQLLSFVTLLVQTNVQDELFPLASLGLEDACKRPNVIGSDMDARTTWYMGSDEWDDLSLSSQREAATAAKAGKVSQRAVEGVHDAQPGAVAGRCRYGLRRILAAVP